MQRSVALVETVAAMAIISGIVGCAAHVQADHLATCVRRDPMRSRDPTCGEWLDAAERAAAAKRWELCVVRVEQARRFCPNELPEATRATTLAVSCYRADWAPADERLASVDPQERYKLAACWEAEANGGSTIDACWREVPTPDGYERRYVLGAGSSQSRSIEAMCLALPQHLEQIGGVPTADPDAVLWPWIAGELRRGMAEDARSRTEAERELKRKEEERLERERREVQHRAVAQTADSDSYSKFQQQLHQLQQTRQQGEQEADATLEAMLRSQNLPGPAALPAGALCRGPTVGGTIVQRIRRTKKYDEYEFVHGGSLTPVRHAILRTTTTSFDNPGEFTLCAKTKILPRRTVQVTNGFTERWYVYEEEPVK